MPIDVDLDTGGTVLLPKTAKRSNFGHKMGQKGRIGAVTVGKIFQSCRFGLFSSNSLERWSSTVPIYFDVFLCSLDMMIFRYGSYVVHIVPKSVGLKVIYM